MRLGRLIGRVVGGVVGLGLLAAVFAVGLPIFLLVLIGFAGAVLLFTVGLPMLIVGILVVTALAAIISLTVGLASFGMLLLKVAVVAILASWLFRLLFGRSRKQEPVLVGPPIAEVSAPRRDKYAIEAERELDRELGL